jgi:hypothetical protein
MKHSSQIVETDEGMQIDVSETQPERARRRKPKSSEPASNVTVERSSHGQKQHSEIRLTDEGIQIDDNEEH